MFGHRYFGSRYFGPRYWGDGGAATPVEPPVVIPSGGRPARRPQTQFAKLRSFEERDEYGTLVARQGQAATRRGELQTLHEQEQFGTLAARSIVRASLSGAHVDEILASVSARRGLPNMQLLIVFLNSIER